MKGNFKYLLIRQDHYTLHRPIRHRFRRRQIFSKGIHDLWQADLVDIQSFVLNNDGVKYLLTCIDTFSKYDWVRPLKNKSGLCVKEALKSILIEKVPLYLQTNIGTEFKNTLFQGQLTECKITFYTSENDDINAAIVERFNRALRTRMYRYLGTLRIQKLSICRCVTRPGALVQPCCHSSIGMSPASVNAKNERLVWHNYFTNTRKTQNGSSTSVNK